MNAVSRLYLFTLMLCCVIACATSSNSNEGDRAATQAKPTSKVTEQLPHSSSGQIIHFMPESVEQPPQPGAEGVFIDTQHAWVRQEGQMIRTTDSGRTWQQFRLSSADEAIFGKPRDMYIRVSFPTPARGWLMANSGTWQTEDGGLTWRRIFAEPYSSIQFADAQHGWMFITSKSEGQNYLTRDGGVTWQPCGSKHRDGEQVLGPIAYFLNSQLGWTLTNQTIKGSPTVGVMHTTDGGCHWKLLWTSDNDNFNDPDERYCDIYFLNKREGWLAGCYIGSVLHTEDGGNTWSKMPLPSKGLTIVSIYFVNSEAGWIIGGHQNMSSEDTGVYRTTDGGHTWQQLTVGDIVSGMSLTDEVNASPTEWKAGKLLQMLYASRASNLTN